MSLNLCSMARYTFDHFALLRSDVALGSISHRTRTRSASLDSESLTYVLMLLPRQNMILNQRCVVWFCLGLNQCSLKAPAPVVDVPVESEPVAGLESKVHNL